MEMNVVLGLKNRRRIKTVLSAPFRPEENAVRILLSPGEKRSVPLEEICYIGLVDAPLQERKPDGPAEEVELLTGERFLIHVSRDEVFGNGFFARAADGTLPFERLFINSAAVKPAEEKALRAPLLEPALGAAGAGAGGASEKEWARIIDSYQREQAQHLPHHNARLGEILIAEGLVSKEEVDSALASGAKKRIGAVLIERGLVTEDQLLAALAAKFRIRFVNLAEVKPTREAIGTLPKNLVNQMRVIPLDLVGKTLTVATSEPTDSTIPDVLRFITKYNIELVVAVARQISEALDKYYNMPAESLDAFISEMEEEQPVVVEQTEEFDYSEPDSKVILLVNKILIEAFRQNVSDIHFEPELDKGPLLVRYRVDGECVISHEIPTAHKHAVVARLKIMAKLDIAERRKPQSGKIFLLYEKKKLEYRLEITPTVEGQEDAVLRLLTAAKPLSLHEMGFSSENLVKFTGMVQKPYGIILCAGPTGSGKTTTLHSALATINSPERKIWTAEDPVEIIQKGLRQVQVNAKIGFNFEDAMRSFLRADPDVIMIGEMRDAETSKTAIAASLTGHLVFSTLHTNSAPETVGRLIEMGLDPYNFSDALLGIIAQRLARKLCTGCKTPYHPSREEYDEIVAHYGENWFRDDRLPEYGDELQLMGSAGCEKCGGTGYKGRIALHELLVNSPEVKRAIKRNASVEDLRDLALRDGMRTLKMDGIQKVFQGTTDLKQILKVCIL
jgi:type II secretory ATPase GspE/PulE/Tfp pilus assembly ATPase PilB-like protein